MRLLSEQSANVTTDFMDFEKEDIIGLLQLQMQLLVDEDIFASFDECANMWVTYSNNLCAGWLIMPKTGKEIINHIKSDDMFISFEESAKS